MVLDIRLHVFLKILFETLHHQLQPGLFLTVLQVLIKFLLITQQLIVSGAYLIVWQSYLRGSEHI